MSDNLSDQKKTKSRRDPKVTREKLLRASLNIVAEKGVEALSMKEVALKANISRSVAYRHFEDRDDLIAETRSWISNQLQLTVEEGEENSSIYSRVLNTTLLVMENPEATKVMIIDALTKGGLDLHDPLFNMVYERLEGMKRDGQLSSDTDSEIATYIHLGSIAATLMYLDRHVGENKKMLASRFAGFWSAMLKDSMLKDLDMQ